MSQCKHRGKAGAESDSGRPRGAARAPRQELLWLYGLHAVRAALDNPARRCHRLVLTAEAARGLRTTAPGPPPPAAPRPEIVARREIASLLPEGAVHQGIALAVAPLAPARLEASCGPRPGARGVVVVLDRVSDPHNVGAVLRSAAAFRARAVVVPKRHSPPATGVLAKAASGALETVPLVRVANLARALDALKGMGYWCVGLEARAASALHEAGLTGDVALVLGAEGSGLRRLTAERCDLLARLPIADREDSLNVSAAAAVALYELVRTA